MCDVRDLLERSLSTFVQAFCAAVAVPGPSLWDSVKIGAVGGAIAVAKIVSASKVGTKGTGSLLD